MYHTLWGVVGGGVDGAGDGVVDHFFGGIGGEEGVEDGSGEYFGGEPGLVIVGVEDDGHAVVEVCYHGIGGGGDYRGSFEDVAFGRVPDFV